MDPGYSHDDWPDAPPARRMWTLRRQRHLALLVAISVLLGTVLLVARPGVSRPGSGTLPTASRAGAVGIELRIPGRDVERIAAARPIAGTTPAASDSRDTWRFPHDGSVATIEHLTAAATARTRSGSARIDIGSVTMLGGRVRLDHVHLSSDASIPARRAQGAITLSPDTTLTINGRQRELRANRVLVVRGVGTLTINEQAVLARSPDGDRQTGPRYRTAGAALHLRLSHPTGGLPAGAQLIIGRVESGVRRGRVRAAGSAQYTPPRAPSPTGDQLAAVADLSLQAGGPAPGHTTLPRRTATARGVAPAPTAPLRGYVFPVLGQSNFTDTFGGFRADVPQGHQGNDIFAAEGTPIVAVADGVLDRVGWNPIGGYRFWLFDRYGNAFYHAHLSAYTPLARDGAYVHAGDVIGFVGHTGDAQGTPDHLHFEVHPHNGPAIDPYPFLTACRSGESVAADALGQAVTDGSLPPLTLLTLSDISANSGLEPTVLDHVPDTTRRPVEQESAPVDTADSLGAALAGDGIS